MYDFLFGLLVFVAVTATGSAVVFGLRSARKTAVTRRLEGIDERPSSLDPMIAKPLMHRAVERTGKMVASKKHTNLQRQLARAGYHGTDAPALYLGAKVILLMLGLAGLGVLLFPIQATFQVKALSIVGGAALLSFVPNLIVRERMKRRTKEVRLHLPDVLDLLEICVTSGIGVEMAWNSVAERIRPASPTLADEMSLTDLEIHLGAARGVAMKHMAERTGSEDMSSLVATLSQSERFGTSISDALRVFASSLREKRSIQAAEAGEKVAVKLLFPMILFIFPALVLVTVGPAGLILVEIFRNLE
jgi:tight adherence protein C